MPSFCKHRFKNTRRTKMKISLSCYGEVNRFCRLANVLSDVVRLATEDGLADRVIQKIDEIHDHKGCLTVTWEIMPTLAEKEIVEKAWELQNEYFVEHELVDGAQIDGDRRLYR
jgi:hypothetical protein